jgi:hypothetical protein
MASFLARLHELGILPPDLHPENLLVKAPAEGSTPEPVLIDLAGTRIGKRVTNREAARNLADLAPWFMLRTRVVDRLRFLRAYWRHRWDGDRAAFDRLLHEVERSALRGRRRLWARRDRRIRGENAYFASLSAGMGIHARVCLRVRNGALPAALAAPEYPISEWLEVLPGLLDPADGRADRSESVPWRVCRNHASPLQGLLWRCVGTTAFREFLASQRLRHRDIPARHLAALAQRRLPGRVCETWIIDRTDRVCLSLQEAWRSTHSRIERACLRDATAKLIGEIFDRGVSGDGWSLGSFAVLQAARVATELPVVFLNHFEGLHLGRGACLYRAIWSLGIFHLSLPRDVSRTDKARALRIILRHAPKLRARTSWRSLWRRVRTVLED